MCCHPGSLNTRWRQHQYEFPRVTGVSCCGSSSWVVRLARASRLQGVHSRSCARTALRSQVGVLSRFPAEHTSDAVRCEANGSCAFPSLRGKKSALHPFPDGIPSWRPVPGSIFRLTQVGQCLILLLWEWKLMFEEKRMVSPFGCRSWGIPEKRARLREGDL